MCGAFSDPITKISAVEWNAACDPLAADIVYHAGVRIHRSIGLNVTRKAIMDERKFKERFRYELHKPILDFAGTWFERRKSVTFHDPLAGATIFNDTICRFQRGTVEMDLQEGKKRGRTNWNPHQSGKHEVAVNVDVEQFFQEYFSIFHLHSK